MVDLKPYTHPRGVSLLYFDENYAAAESVAGLNLESADVQRITARVRDLADARHLVFPESDTLLERCVIALLGGHVILQGPPGTGKTTLAYALAEAFDATARLETATADWSTYDVIGGLHPTSKGGIETLEPWLGHVPRAALECASVVARHEDAEEHEPNQAHWLIIDEFNRAEIDKAIGPLYTVLGRRTSRQPAAAVVRRRERQRHLGVDPQARSDHRHDEHRGRELRLHAVAGPEPALPVHPRRRARPSATRRRTAAGQAHGRRVVRGDVRSGGFRRGRLHRAAPR